MNRIVVCGIFLIGFGSLTARPLRADKPADGIEFFEKEIRPLLVEHCVKCHGGEKVRGGLKLTTSSDIRRGGDSGPIVVPGKPSDSLLVKMVRYTDAEHKMPPTGKLPDRPIAALENWVEMGAPLPRDGSVAINDPDSPIARSHWAFQPIQEPIFPIVRNPAWIRSPLDHLVLAKLEARGLSPSPPADRRTLIRRAYFDLIGLPPTFEEVQAFENDPTPDAFDRIIQRLLASPQYGERWGRHWLDVARYADTKDGVLMFGDSRLRPFAYTFRDYVIQAFNEDRPFDQFVREQLAADLIKPAVDPSRLAGLGFLTLGRMFDNNIHDIIDDRIDTVSRGLLGLTVSCARCHDHKYDPIPTADYYSLYGVFASSEAPLVPPSLEPLARGPAEFEKKYAAKAREIQDMLDRQYALLSETARARVADYLVHVVTVPPDPLETAIFFLSLAPTDLRPPLVARWRLFLSQRVKHDDPIFGPWHDLFALSDDEFDAEAAAVLKRCKINADLNPLVREALLGAHLEAKVDVARAYGTLFKQIYDQSKSSNTPLDAARKAILDILIGQDSPTFFPKSQTRRYMSRGDTDAFGTKLQEFDVLAVKEARATPRAMSLIDSPNLHDPRVFIRGNPARPGNPVPRQFPRILAGNSRQPFANGSGRLELADSITSHPLVARVLVNRVWMHHFGEPLVDTPNDFGLRTAKPLQSELLDYLATTLRTNGGSMKHLHRLIMRSSTYQQTSFDRPSARAVDPDNRFLWRANRRRLDMEPMRDSMLAVSGQINSTLYGRPSGLPHDPQNRRRTIYGLVDRQSVPTLFRAFDFASPDQSAERRTQTTVPQQALFGMNSEFVIEQARAIVNLPEFVESTEFNQKINALYRIILQRNPDMDELRIGAAFVTKTSSAEKSKLSTWEQFAQVLLLTNERMFVD